MGTLTYNKIFGKKLTSYLLKRKKDRILKDWKKNNLIECINILPFMNRDNLANYIKEEIDILVNIDANLGDFNIFLSSKIVDYISYRKPILNITNEGASVDFLEDFGIKYYLSYKEKNFKILNTNNIEDLRPRIFNIGKYESSELIKKLIKKLEER